MEDFIATLSRLDIGYVYLVVFLIAYIENIFPPLPSDVIVVFAGSLVGLKGGNGALTVSLATVGSTLGFATMYWIGKQVGLRVIESGRVTFISPRLVARVEAWFRKYGYWVVVVNRFLAGTRAVIAFCAGVSELNLPRTILLSTVSSLLYNALLVYLGMTVGEHWREIGEGIETYGTVVTAALLLIALLWAAKVYVRRRRNNRQSTPNP